MSDVGVTRIVLKSYREFLAEGDPTPEWTNYLLSGIARHLRNLHRTGGLDQV